MSESDTTRGAPLERMNSKGRAFLVQLSPDCQPAAGTIRGRVQQLDTADGGNFTSVADLLALLARILSRTEND
jgi:hypothetical protein